MGALQVIFVLVCTPCILRADGRKTYGDMFSHSHAFKSPVIPGWSPDSNPWDDYLYPPFKSGESRHRTGKPIVAHLTSDSPAMNGSCITFTTTLQFPKCQKEDARGDLVYDEHCKDDDGQARSGYVYSWTSWMEDYGFTKCPDPSKCNVFPDGTPFPQRNDWRRRNYIYVWHTMGQYYQTCGGSFSSLTLNTTNITLGADIMEVVVYQSHSRRKYSPVASDSGVYFVTDKIPLAVNLSQKKPANLSENVFIKDSDIIFNVLIHDPSKYLRTAAFVDFIWDFSDGNRLVTHSNVAVHAYSTVGNATVKLTVKAAFPVPCPPPTPTPTPTLTPMTTSFTSSHTTESHTSTSTGETSSSTATTGHTSTQPNMTTGSSTKPPTTTAPEVTTGFNVTSTSPKTTTAPLFHHSHHLDALCYRNMYGNFETEIFIVEINSTEKNRQAVKIVDVSAAKVTNATVNFLIECLGSIPTSACTIISDPACKQVKDIICDPVPPSERCLVTLRRTFQQPGTYCVNISLPGSHSRTLASTRVTIGSGGSVSKPMQATVVVLSTSAVLAAIFAFIASMVYRRYRVYRPVRRGAAAEQQSRQLKARLGQLKMVLFQANEEKSHLLSDPRPI
ncbi:protein QNR-71 [Paramormyrops kingsleyae]|uniref:Glycoprotein nmb n=1 Tax=Paramormyrops kingsleyae TaxID=1676925 RepID=A0A3B3SPK8_9TELE|nr:transmembrane glycoprotein NMB [Paramormyrops kingsleyae]